MDLGFSGGGLVKNLADVVTILETGGRKWILSVHLVQLSRAEQSRTRALDQSRAGAAELGFWKILVGACICGGLQVYNSSLGITLPLVCSCTLFA
jgi:hypothetical protein